MEKRKKPPPGATLIQRLREARQRREQTEGAAEPEPPVTQQKAKAPPPVSPAQAAAKPAPARRKGLQASAEQAVEVEVVQSPPAKAEVSLRAAQPVQADFIRRTISIDDLRPVSDDYDQLTEEIKLAGRFAAAGLVAQGLRLARLKDDALYKEHYGTFEEYCRTEHLMSATYAYRLIRMAEMAERLAEEGSKSLTEGGSASMPDPFEVMLSLGHRHLMALLPLETETAEELLTRGIPLSDPSGKSVQRIPITRATEQQIKEAISHLVHETVQEAVRKSMKQAPPAVPIPRSVRTIHDLVEVLQDWADWLESEPQPRVLAAKIGEGREPAKMAQQIRKASDRLAEALETLPRGGKSHKH